MELHNEDHPWDCHKVVLFPRFINIFQKNYETHIGFLNSQVVLRQGSTVHGFALVYCSMQRPYLAML